MKVFHLLRKSVPVIALISNLLFSAVGIVSAAEQPIERLTHTNLLAKKQSPTTTTALVLVPTFESISVYAQFSGDGNENNKGQLFYRQAGSSNWIEGMAMTVDRRQSVTGGNNSYNNPYVNQWRTSLIGLNPNTSYDVRVDFTDPDGINGSSSLVQTISTMNDNFPSSGSAYYVAPNGSDSNPGNINQPFKTISKGVSLLKAGDKLFVRGGTYNERVVIAQREGTVSNWITIQAYPNETPIIDGTNSQTHNFYIGGWAEPKTQFVRIKGFRLTNAPTAITINEKASNIVIDGNTIDNFTDNGIYIGLWNTSNTPTARIIIQNNTITRTKIPGGNGGTNIGLYSNAGGHIIRNNLIQDITGNPHDGGGATHLDCIGGGPDFNLDTGLYRDSDVYDNTIIDCNDDAIQADGSAMNVRIWGNTLLGRQTNYSGISTAPTILGPIYIFRNLLTGQLIDGFKQGQNSSGTQYIYHNTFYTTRASADGFFQTDPGLKNVVAHNNILQAGRYVIEYSEPSSSSGNSWNYNNLTTTNANRFVYLNNSNLNYAGFRGVSYESNGLSVLAGNEFTNVGGGDFRLRSGSQFQDKGMLIQGFNDPNSKWAFGGSAPDLGAYELPDLISPASAPAPTPAFIP